MNCPPDLADTLLDLLRHATLRARAAGWAGNAEQAAMEADHVHNLPEMLKTYSPGLLQYYWDASRASFLSEAARANIPTEDFNPFWDRMRQYLDSPTQVALIN